MRLILSLACAGTLAAAAPIHGQGTQSGAGQATQSASAPTSEYRPHEKTSLPAAARYEIIQSAVAAKITLRLDRWSGEVDQMVSRADSSIGWQGVPRELNPVRDQQIVAEANYQIFSSGIAIRYTFLINSNTGATWQLTEDPSRGLFWLPIY
jgi:hypothetical protein